ncbi:hypothetical protein NP233_g9534 [Leucocoprinus birnbaumii]|uniref:Uncharacterized protein n=1 Tax=Leucocoprinus birnbaumii TaxID=56174 RepID=A0AAD5VQR2_9AGAR|nr:hypothetical protein NP233_g9534 [Leucocoprinus birnbaumii]
MYNELSFENLPSSEDPFSHDSEPVLPVFSSTATDLEDAVIVSPVKNGRRKDKRKRAKAYYNKKKAGSGQWQLSSLSFN